jgi:hypothetical protein
MNTPTDSAALPPMAGSAIPEDVAICPECGGKLFFNEDYDTDTESDEPPGIDCENEPDLDDDEEDFHRYWQSDWQPVIDKISAHYRGQNAGAVTPGEKGKSNE